LAGGVPDLADEDVLEDDGVSGLLNDHFGRLGAGG
jgi:hypothetical protein